MPVSEQGLASFVAFAVQKCLKYSTVKSYLSAIRHLQISWGGGDPNFSGMPQLELTVRGIRKEQVGMPKRERLPITPSILVRMRMVWERQAAS